MLFILLTFSPPRCYWLFIGEWRNGGSPAFTPISLCCGFSSLNWEVFLALFVRFPPSLKTQQFQISVRSELERREDVTEPIVKSSFEYFMVLTDWLYLQIPSPACHLNRLMSTAKPPHLYIVTWWCRLKYSDQCLLPFLNGLKYWAVALEKISNFL